MTGAELEIQEKIQELADANQGFYSVAARGLRSGREVLLEESELHPAASVIKVPILAAALGARDMGRLSLDQSIRVRKQDHVGGSGVLLEMHADLMITLRDALHLMIVVSDNTATNLVIDAVGLEFIREFLLRHGYTQIRLERRLFDMEARSRGLDNWISATQMLSMLESLYKGELEPLTPDSCAEAIQIMKRQQFHDKIHALLPKGTEVADKTGGLDDVTHDVGIVWPETGEPYALALLAKELEDTRAAGRVLAQMSRELFDHYSLT